MHRVHLNPSSASMPSLSENEAIIPPWSDVPLRVKLEFFNKWHFWCLIGNGGGVLAAILGVISDYGQLWHIIEYYHLTLGLVAIIACINMMRYIEYVSQLHILVITMRLSFGAIVRFVFSTVPIFIGYVLFGMICFSQYSDLFKSFDISSVTLFSVMNGDIIFDSFEQLARQYPYPWVTRIYLYTSISLFILVIMNIAVFLIQDAFVAAKSFNRFTQKFLHEPKKRAVMSMQTLALVLDVAEHGSSLDESEEMSPLMDRVEHGSPQLIRQTVNGDARGSQAVLLIEKDEQDKDVNEKENEKQAYAEKKDPDRQQSNYDDDVLERQIRSLLDDHQREVAEETEKKFQEIRKFHKKSNKALQEKIKALIKDSRAQSDTQKSL